MSRLVVVSNRVANLRDATQAGGLAVAMREALSDSGGVWFGWDGNIVAPGNSLHPEFETTSGISTATMPLTRKDYREYYAGFSNSVLWPLLHYRLDLIAFRRADLNGYKRVNVKFADSLSPLLKKGDIVWVHDYHLFPLGAELRKRGHGQPIGFFLHIPFPPPDILTAAPEHRWLVRSLFAYDVIGFQTHTDLGNFHRYLEDYAEGGVDGEGRARGFGTSIRAGCFPIGIDVDGFRDMARTPEADEQITRLHQRSLARQLIIGVDRLDYSKGLPDRLRAFERLLELYPENRKTVTFMQIAPPTREDVSAYADIREELERLSGAINGRFADFDWTPLRYIHRAVPRSTLAALLRGCDVGFISPLRDGMNLVAKEFVAAQDDDDPGVLVLSKFAGAAEELHEALIVNPYDVDEMANNLQAALRMPVGQRKQRHQALMARIREHDVRAWYHSFLAALREASTARGL